MTTTYNKLIRDHIPRLIQSSGATCETETLSDEEYLEKLDEKLDEEIAEYRESKNVEELADILEVVYAMAETQGYDTEHLERIRKEKAEKRGAFKKKILLKSVTE